MNKQETKTVINTVLILKGDLKENSLMAKRWTCFHLVILLICWRPLFGAEMHVTGDEIFGYMQEMAAFVPSPVGTENDIKSRQYNLKLFEAFSLKDVHEEVYPFPSAKQHARWDRGGYKLSLLGQEGKQELFCAREGATARAPEGGLSAELVDAGSLRKALEDLETQVLDVKGKAVLLHVRMKDQVQSRMKEKLQAFEKELTGSSAAPIESALLVSQVITALFQHHAAGVIVSWDDSPTGQPYLREGRPFFRGAWQKDRSRIVLSVDGAVGYALGQAAQSPNARVLIENKPDNYQDDNFFPSGRIVEESGNVVAWLPGKTNEIIMVGGHTNHFSILNNPSGNACLLGVAKHFSQVPLEKRQKTLLFVGFGTHGFHARQGSNAFVQKHRQDILPKITIMLNLDHVPCKEFTFTHGKGTSTGQNTVGVVFIANFNTYIRHAIEKAIPASNMAPIEYLPFQDMAGDGKAFSKAGIPTAWISTNQKQGWTDSFIRYTPKHLEQQTRAYIDIIESLDGVSLADMRAEEEKGKNLTLGEIASKAEHAELKKILIQYVQKMKESLAK